MGREIERFFAELRKAYEAAGEPTLDAMQRLGGGRSTTAPVLGSSSLSEWLGGVSVPAKASEGFLLDLVAYLHQRAALPESGRSGVPVRVHADRALWLSMVRAARKERAAERPGGRPRAREREVRPVSGPVTLPPPPDDFAGRTAELDEVLRCLDPEADGSATATATAVVVSAVAGMGGIGKTALALHAAHQAHGRGRFPGGAVFADLRGYSAQDPVGAGAVADRLLRAMGVPARQLPGTDDGSVDAWQRLLNSLAVEGTSLLVVLDNVRDLGQVGALLPRSPHRALVTSRQALSSLPAHRVSLAPLPPDEAVAVLNTALRAGETDDVRCAADPVGALDLAELCGRLPLALRITAALLRADSERPLAAHAADLREVRSRLDALELDEEDAEGRPLAVRASLDLSYRHLTAESARALSLLATIPGPDVSTATAAAVLDLPRPDARRHLAGLARHHLLTRADLSNAGADAVLSPEDAERWSLHDLVRLYGTEQADRHPPEVAAAARRLDVRFTELTAAARDCLGSTATPAPGPAPAPAAHEFGSATQVLAWLDAERANLVALVAAARQAGRWRSALTVTSNLHHYLEEGWYGADAYQCGTHAVEAARHLTPADLAAALSFVGNACRLTGRLDEGVERLTEAVGVAGNAGRPGALSSALHNLGLVHARRGDWASAEHVHRLDVELSRSCGDRRGEAMALVALADTHRASGAPQDAVSATVRAAHLVRETADVHGSAMVALSHAQTLLYDGRTPIAALTLLACAVRDFRTTGSQAKVAVASIKLGAAYGARCMVCHGSDAVRWTREGLALAEAGTDQALTAQALHQLGSFLAHTGDRAGARPVLERAVAACTAVGDTERTRAARSTLSHLGKPKKPLICDETPPPGPGEQFDVTEAIETIAGGAPKTLCLVADPVWRALFGVDRDPT
ncbi:tetratricopeptide repeat protein [Streptomyces sp. NBC_00370]|uniref:tetratricopeptide repeat protein n=1 Tax=Streptomyces sp. NBC_00370 TaxID=2975728 RepID=UPI002E273970